LRAEANIRIDRPCADVFPYLCDTKKITAWREALTEVSKVSDGPVAPGATFEVALRLGGQALKGTMRYHDLAPDEWIDYAIEGDGYTIDGRFILDSDEGSTDLLWTTNTRRAGLAFKLMQPILRGRAQKALDDDLSRLKGLVESS
jgi:carbon monoxide dehydrogenase subunit G